MGYSGAIITGYKGFDFELRKKVLEEIMKKCGYCFVIRNDYILVQEYYTSEANVIIGLCSNPDECCVDFIKGLDDVIDPFYFEDVCHSDLVLKILYEYLRIFPQDMYTDYNTVFTKEHIYEIYNSDDWERWVYINPRNRIYKNISEQDSSMKIRYPLKRDGKYQIILRKMDDFDGVKLKKYVMSFVEEMGYKYYIYQRENCCFVGFVHNVICIDTGETMGNLFEIDIREQINLYEDEHSFDMIESGLCKVATIKYVSGGEKFIKDFMQKYFEWYPDDYMYNTNEYDYSETGERIYTKDTISTFGE